jgi:hypothetical protein
MSMAGLRSLLIMVPCLTLAGLVGCARPAGPTHLTVAADQYDRAFDAAAGVARSHGLVPGLRDRRGGVIETEPARAGSIFEPWETLTTSFGHRVESTLAYQRRRARFEFLPVGFDPEAARPTDDVLPGPDVFATSREPIDLTTFDGELELRVWVYVERLHAPGLRRSTWSRRMTQRSQIIDPETERPIPGAWATVARDPEIERKLLTLVERELRRKR